MEGQEHTTKTKKKISQSLKEYYASKEPIINKVKLALRVMVIVAVMLGIYWFNAWSQYNTINVQSPIVLRTPVYITHKEPVILSPIAEAKEPEHTPMTKEELIKGAVNNEIVQKVHIIETSRGKNSNSIALHNVCSDYGLTNEFGFNPFAKDIHDRCFDSFAESVQTVDNWFTKRFEEGFTKEQALCYYNTGMKVNSCDYVDTFNSL